VLELPFAADCCPCVEKLRTVLPSTVGIRDGAVHLVSNLGSVVTATGGAGRYRTGGGACGRLVLALECVHPVGDGRAFVRLPRENYRLGVRGGTVRVVGHVGGLFLRLSASTQWVMAERSYVCPVRTITCAPHPHPALILHQ
jgi:hypothetical protein